MYVFHYMLFRKQDPNDGPFWHTLFIWRFATLTKPPKTIKNKSTVYLFMFTLISMISLSGTLIRANSNNHTNATGKSAAIISGPSEACQGAAGSVYETERGMLNYQWSVVPDGIITTGNGTNEITISWEATGSHMVSVTYMDASGIGTIYSGSLGVSVSRIPGDPQPITGQERVCQGESGITYTTPPIIYATEYAWVVPPGATIIPGEKSNTIKVAYSSSSTSGYVRVFGKNFCGQGNVSPFFPVAVHEIPPTPNVNLEGDLLHSSSVEGNQWFRDGAMIPNGIKQDLQVTQNGRYW